MNNLALLFALSLCLFWWKKTVLIEDHGIYISVIKIQHVENESSATVQMRVFADDLKDALRNEFGYEAVMEQPTFCQDYQQYIHGYFEKGFICTINNAPVAYQLADCARVEDVYQLIFTMDCPTEWTTAKIEAPFFMELFPSQSNIVHLENGTTKRFGRAIKGDELLRIRF
ncbi:MAG: DUF6702 family protein [Bacteroidota bacterium]